jgi:hypothetical protein
MLVAIKNLTTNDITDLGLTSLQSKAVWNNKPFWHPNGSDIRPVLFQHIQAGEVVGLNEFDETIIYWNEDQNEIINQSLADDMALFTGQNFGNDENIVKAERDAAQDFFVILARVFRRIKQSGLPNYNIQDMSNAIESKNICALLNMGANKQAANAINAITTDAFFTVGRKGQLAAICGALDLG